MMNLSREPEIYLVINWRVSESTAHHFARRNPALTKEQADDAEGYHNEGHKRPTPKGAGEGGGEAGIGYKN